MLVHLGGLVGCLVGLVSVGGDGDPDGDYCTYVDCSFGFLVWWLRGFRGLLLGLYGYGGQLWWWWFVWRGGGLSTSRLEHPLDGYPSMACLTGKCLPKW